MWWKFKELGQSAPHDYIAERLLAHVKDPPVPVVSVARGLGIQVLLDAKLSYPCTFTNIGAKQARIELPATQDRSARARYLVAKGIEQILFREVGANALTEEPSLFADALLVPGRVLEFYGPRADWDVGRLAEAFGVPNTTIHRRLGETLDTHKQGQPVGTKAESNGKQWLPKQKLNQHIIGSQENLLQILILNFEQSKPD